MKRTKASRTDRAGFGIRNAARCVLCGRPPGRAAGYIPQPVDRRPAGVRCGWCYARYLRKYFPEAVVARGGLGERALEADA